jgi:hypothetical protein
MAHPGLLPSGPELLDPEFDSSTAALRILVLRATENQRWVVVSNVSRT